MSNHVRMAIQAGAEPLAGFMRFVASRYARYFDRKLAGQAILLKTVTRVESSQRSTAVSYEVTTGTLFLALFFLFLPQAPPERVPYFDLAVVQ